MRLFVLEEVQEENGRRERILLMVAAAFVFFNAIALSLAVEGALRWAHLWAPLLWLAMIVAGHGLLHRYKPQRDPFIFPLVALMTGWGLLLIDRLAANFLARQVIWLGLATAVLLAITILPRNLNLLRRYRYTWLFGGLLLLAGTLLFGVNPSGFGAALWLPVPFFGGVYFQPSELLKLLLIVFLASYFDEREAMLPISQQKGWAGIVTYLAPLLLMWGFCIILLTWQRDLGAAALFFIVFLALLYVATGDLRFLLVGCCLPACLPTSPSTWWRCAWKHGGTRGPTPTTAPSRLCNRCMLWLRVAFWGKASGKAFPSTFPSSIPTLSLRLLPKSGGWWAASPL
jgi:hypothetical protein